MSPMGKNAVSLFSLIWDNSNELFFNWESSGEFQFQWVFYYVLNGEKSSELVLPGP